MTRVRKMYDMAAGRYLFYIEIATEQTNGKDHEPWWWPWCGASNLEHDTSGKLWVTASEEDARRIAQDFSVGKGGEGQPVIAEFRDGIEFKPLAESRP